MSSTITAIAVIGVLAIWHVRNLRHPGWRASSDGRFNIYCGYFLVIKHELNKLRNLNFPWC